MTDFIQDPIILIGLKSLPLILLAFAATKVMKHVGCSAGNRSLVWTSTLLGLVLLPVFSHSVPAWHLGRHNNSPVPMIPTSALHKSTSPETEINHTMVEAREAVTASTTRVPLNLAEFSPQVPASGTQSPFTTTAQWIFLVWFTGFLCILATMSLGWSSLFRLRRQARECLDEEWLGTLKQIQSTLGIKRSIRLMMSSQRDIPMTWGTIRPVLHLPLKARQWSRTEREAVLLHELAHIRRFDSVHQMVAHVASAIYWYNPLVWIGIKKLRSEQESACDDTVLRYGPAAPTYADHLASIVSGRSTMPWENAIALAAGRPGKLEARIEHILSKQASRRHPNSRHVGTIMSVTAVCSLLIGTFSPFTPSVIADTHSTTQIDSETLSDLTSLQATLIERSFQSVDGRLMTRAAIESMIQSLNDPHAEYLHPEELATMQRHLDGELFGIGAQLRMTNEQLEIVKPMTGSPAIEAGLESGDIILAVDGIAARGKKLTYLVNLIRGPHGSTVQLTVKRADLKHEITVTRGQIKLPSVHGMRGIETSNGIKEPATIGTNNNIAYLQISYFGKHTAEELHERLTQLNDQNRQGAIIDLRYCPGGTLGAATKVANLFLGAGDIVTIHDREGGIEKIIASKETHWKFPLIVLVNEATASAGEILCGALQDHDRAIIVGTRTFGKASVQTLLQISDKLGAVKLTTAKYTPPSGRNIERMPGAATWGIEANEGFFIAASDPNDSIKNRLQDTLALESTPIQLDMIAPPSLRQVLGDPQLAGALEAMESRLKEGKYEAVGGSRKALGDYIAHQELKNQHATLVEKLHDLQSAVSTLIEEKH